MLPEFENGRSLRAVASRKTSTYDHHGRASSHSSVFLEKVATNHCSPKGSGQAHILRQATDFVQVHRPLQGPSSG
jgi:hypothetical protein